MKDPLRWEQNTFIEPNFCSCFSVEKKKLLSGLKNNISNLFQSSILNIIPIEELVYGNWALATVIAPTARAAVSRNSLQVSLIAAFGVELCGFPATSARHAGRHSVQLGQRTKFGFCFSKVQFLYIWLHLDLENVFHTPS